MDTRYFDDVVTFLPQRQRNSPAAVGSYVQDHYAKSEILDFRHYFGNMLVRAGDECIANRTALSQCHQIATQLALNAFSTPRQGVDQPEFQARHLGECIVLRGPTPLGSGLVPVATEHRQAGAVPG